MTLGRCELASPTGPGQDSRSVSQFALGGGASFSGAIRKARRQLRASELRPSKRGCARLQCMQTLACDSLAFWPRQLLGSSGAHLALNDSPAEEIDFNSRHVGERARIWAPLAGQPLGSPIAAPQSGSFAARASARTCRGTQTSAAHNLPATRPARPRVHFQHICLRPAARSSLSTGQRAPGPSHLACARPQTGPTNRLTCWLICLFRLFASSLRARFECALRADKWRARAFGGARKLARRPSYLPATGWLAGWLAGRLATGCPLAWAAGGTGPMRVIGRDLWID